MGCFFCHEWSMVRVCEIWDYSKVVVLLWCVKCEGGELGFIFLV